MITPYILFFYDLFYLFVKLSQYLIKYAELPFQTGEKVKKTFPTFI